MRPSNLASFALSMLLSLTISWPAPRAARLAAPESRRFKSDPAIPSTLPRFPLLRRRPRCSKAGPGLLQLRARFTASSSLRCASLKLRHLKPQPVGETQLRGRFVHIGPALSVLMVSSKHATLTLVCPRWRMSDLGVADLVLSRREFRLPRRLRWLASANPQTLPNPAFSTGLVDSLLLAPRMPLQVLCALAELTYCLTRC